MKQIITKDDVAKAIQDLVEKGKKPSLAAIHASLNGRGSMSTLVRLKAEIDATAKSDADSPEELKAFREIWSMVCAAARTGCKTGETELHHFLMSTSSGGFVAS